MFRLFYKYLILNKKASVPGLGIFYIEQKPAKLDFANKVLHAPALQIAFNQADSNSDNGLLAFISAQQNVDEIKAAEQYNAFADKLLQNLDKHSSVELPQVGVLSQNEQKKLFFEAVHTVKDYFPDVAAQRISREHVEPTVLAGDIRRTRAQIKEKPAEEIQEYAHLHDNWWIFAVALGIIGVATIVYYYMHNGNLH